MGFWVGFFVFSVKTESQENHYGLKMIYPVTVFCPPGCDPDFPGQVPAEAAAGEVGGGSGQRQAPI